MKRPDNKTAAVWIVLLLLAATGFLAAALFFTGVLQFNHPSANRYPVRGVDVSHYQGEIDWKVLSEQGISFAYIKATEGSSSQDERFASHWSEAQKTGLRIGAYHFFSFESAGKTQAENFLATVEPFPGMLPPAADVEPYGGFTELTAEVLDELTVWIRTVEERCGVKPIVYTTETYYGAVRERFPENDVWIRSVYRKPSDGVEWTFWQYSARTRLKGYSGEERFIDMNVFAGTKEEFRNWAVPCGGKE